MKNISKIFGWLVIINVFFAPTLISAQSKIVPDCNNTITITDPKTGAQSTRVEEACGWRDLIQLINNLIDFIFTYLVMPIAAIMFAYAGFLLITSGGSESKATEAKTIFTKVAFGLIVAAAAWLIVNTLLGLVSKTGMWTWIGFN